MAKRREHHVVPNADGGWDIKKGGGSKLIKHYDRKDDAEARARKNSQNQGSELVIHVRDGKIQRSDSHVNDPYPPKG